MYHSFFCGPRRLALALAAVSALGLRAAAQDSTKEVGSLKAQMQKISERLAQLEAKSTNQPPAAPVAQNAPASRAGSSYMNISFDVVGAAGTSTADDPSKQLELGDHDPQSRGAQVRNAEITVDGNVDPYFKGQGNIVLKLDKNNQTDVELEEAYLQTVSLPANMQVKAGQFFAEFGRQNATHPHTWAFVDSALVLNRMFGGDGLRNPGARISWLAPTPWYTEFLFGVFNGQGGTAFSFRDPETDGTHGRTPIDHGIRGASDLLYVPRVVSSFDLTDNQTLVLGASAAFGSNDSGENTKTQFYGVDQYWKWKPANADAGFPFVSFQTEALYRNYDAGADPANALPAETLHDWGAYSQILWGFAPRWVAGLRGDYVDGNAGADDPTDVYRGERERISPDITFFPSEFSKVRLQYNYDHGKLFGEAHSIWLQVEFLLGSHGAHKF